MKSILISAFLILLFVNVHAQVKIGGTPVASVPSSVLELDGGTTRGLLLPRMRKMDIDSIQNPAEGLTIYATDEQAVYLRKSLAWEKQGPFTLPYYGQYSNAYSGFTIKNNWNEYNATAIRGESQFGNGLLGTSNSGGAVVGIATGPFGVAGEFINREGGTGVICEGILDMLDENGAMIRFFDTTRNSKAFIQMAGVDIKIGTFAYNNPGRFIVRTNNADRLWVDSVGYVTIGGKIGPTLNGPYKLAVKGKIAATDFNVVASGFWPDYVFASDYKLRSLEETEVFIKAHKHLPNIPAASIIDKEGFALGDMQKRMMEKIEELTLYLIDAKKEINILKQQVQVLHEEK